MKWLSVVGLIVFFAAVGLWLAPQNRYDREEWNGGDLGRTPGALGTSGTHDGAAEMHRGDVITEIETITGATDGMSLVGRHVDLHVDVQDRANDYAFWVGSPDNRLLVVLRRDNRDGAERQRGQPSNHRIAPVHGGQRATISGVVRAAPKGEHRYSWNLTRDDENELVDRKIYIDADAVSSEGHGTP